MTRETRPRNTSLLLKMKDFLRRRTVGEAVLDAEEPSRPLPSKPRAAIGTTSIQAMEATEGVQSGVMQSIPALGGGSEIIIAQDTVRHFEESPDMWCIHGFDDRISRIVGLLSVGRRCIAVPFMQLAIFRMRETTPEDLRSTHYSPGNLQKEGVSPAAAYSIIHLDRLKAKGEGYEELVLRSMEAQSCEIVRVR